MEYPASAVLQGQKYAWNLLEKLGEGDAGEVYRVESVSDHIQAILKRPRRSPFTNEVRRQAEQIRLEGRILSILPSILEPIPRLRTPELLDQARSGTEFSERYFIVITRASGFDLSWLARACRLGLEPESMRGLPPNERKFLTTLVDQNHIPLRLILAALSAILAMFDLIHTAHVRIGQADTQGLIWNDVKPDHIFWDPIAGEITIIDWGNSRLLGAGGTTSDLRHTSTDDLRQFFEEMGRFLEQASPELRAELEWPDDALLPTSLTEAAANLSQRIAVRLDQLNQAVVLARSEEETLVQPASHPEKAIDQLEKVHNHLITLGEMPDHAAALRLASGSVANLAAAADLAAVQKLCAWAANLPDAPASQWHLLARLASAAAREQNEARRRMSEAVRFAAAADWENTLWALVSYLHAGPEPDGWNDLLAPVRALAGGEETASFRPLLTLRRAALTLQTSAQSLEDRLVRSSATGDSNPAEAAARLENWNSLLERMRETAQNWIQLDPLPPHSSLVYSEVDALAGEIDLALPGTGSALLNALAPAREHTQAVLEAWDRREFSTAARLLRRVLPWDPDRRRLLRAEQALKLAPDWLHRVRTGPTAGAPLLGSITDMEFEGRELRNRLGPAGWLDSLLDALKAIRQGAWPGDILRTQPALLADMPWLQVYERQSLVRRILQPHYIPAPLPMISGLREDRFGPGEGIAFIEPADAWIPEARGSSARVYHSLYRATDEREAALKLMRIDKADYSLPLFREEVLVFQAMQGVPGVNPILESGFLWLGADPLPPDHDLDAIRALRGEALRIGVDTSTSFLELLENRVREGWTPYLLLEKRRREDNLLLLCDASLNRGNLRPPAELLRIAVQICDVLLAAHQRKVVYRDHKILHYYWQEMENELNVIDWNVARYHPDGLSDLEIHMDLVQLGARGLHHILTGRTAPGALPLGPTRPEEIEQSAQSYRAQWTYDDRRLGEETRVILEQLLAGAYTSAEDLRSDLKRACLNLE